MEMTAILPPRILSHVPGRVRVHLPDWSGSNAGELETHLAGVEGVRAARANSLTGNVLIHFDPRRLSIERLLRELRILQARFHALGPAAGASLFASSGSNPVIRAAVRGALGHAAVDMLLYAATASAFALGWTWIGGLGVIHLVLDTVMWSKALFPLADELRYPMALGAQPESSSQWARLPEPSGGSRWP
jgi:hypothetical protein